jgi:hypothetical protein
MFASRLRGMHHRQALEVVEQQSLVRFTQNIMPFSAHFGYQASLVANLQTETRIPSTTQMQIPLPSIVKTDPNPFRYNVGNPEDAVNSLRDEVAVYQQPKHPTTSNKPPSTVHVIPSSKNIVKADNSPDLRISIDHEETDLTKLFRSEPKVSKSRPSWLVVRYLTHTHLRTAFI